MELIILILFAGLLYLLFSGKVKANRWKPNPNRYQSLRQVNEALRKAGLESSNLIIGIDYTKSNEWNGKKSFGNKCLHHIDRKYLDYMDDVPGASAGARIQLNPYQQVIDMVARTLQKFDDDSIIPVYGFGDSKTQDREVFSLSEYKDGCHGLEDALRRYSEVTPTVKLSGPTSFKPLIDKAVEVCRERGQYHILVIIADGQVTNVDETIDSIVRASSYPLSIIMVGVGDGPWDEMERFDDELPKRKFDNFQFVSFHRSIKNAENPEVSFAVDALMEIPDQYATIKKLRLLGRRR